MTLATQTGTAPARSIRIMTLITNDRYGGGETRTQVRYVDYGEDHLVVVIGEKPGWLLDLQEEPITKAEIGGSSIYVQARFPNALERLRLQAFVAENLPGHDTTHASTHAVLLNPMC
jgi:hypothetical protein